MGNCDFGQAVRERAYYKYLNRERNCICGDAFTDWEQAEREQGIEERIAEEAYLHYTNHGDNPIGNWVSAKNEIMQRLSFIAFYNHEVNYNKSPLENWIEAERIYLSKF